jgi:hypothetical protein
MRDGEVAVLYIPVPKWLAIAAVVVSAILTAVAIHGIEPF